MTLGDDPATDADDLAKFSIDPGAAVCRFSSLSGLILH